MIANMACGTLQMTAMGTQYQVYGASVGLSRGLTCTCISEHKFQLLLQLCPDVSAASAPLQKRLNYCHRPVQMSQLLLQTGSEVPAALADLNRHLNYSEILQSYMSNLGTG